MKDILYASGTLSTGINILDIPNPILNVSDNKRQKGDNIKSSYLWHCHLNHTSERLMTELHHSAILGSFDCDSFDKCESCLLGKDDYVMPQIPGVP